MFAKQVTAFHAVSSSSLAFAAFAMTGELIRDIAALASLAVSVSALVPVLQKVIAWVRAKLHK